MFDTFNGLPIHALVVHAVVVLLPLSILGTIAIAVRPAWRRTYGLLVLGVTFVATALIPVATKSGRALQHRLPFVQLGHHRQLGEQLKYFAIPLLLLVIALVVLDRRGSSAASDATGSRPSGPSGLFSVVNVVAALAVLAGIATGVQVYRVGDSGAHAVWSGVVQASNKNK